MKKRSQTLDRLATKRAAAAARAERDAARAAERSAKGAAYWPRFVGAPVEPVVADFLQHWTPERFIEAWVKSVSSLGIEPARALLSVELTHESVGSETEDLEDSESPVAWWPKQQVEKRRQRLQKAIATLTPPFDLPEHLVDYGTTAGPVATVAQLLSADGDPQRVGAVFVSASLFTRVESSRGRAHYPRGAWPEACVALTLLDWARRIHNCTWPLACTDTLPHHDSDDGLVIENVERFVDVLAVEHARVLHAWTPVVVRIHGPREPTELERAAARRAKRGQRV